MKNYLKKINVYYFLFIFLLFAFVQVSNVDAVAQCVDNSSPVTVNSIETFPSYDRFGFDNITRVNKFPDWQTCWIFCPNVELGVGASTCSFDGVCTEYLYEHLGGTTYSNPSSYCQAGLTPGTGLYTGMYAYPYNITCHNATLISTYNNNAGWCTETYSCGYSKFLENYKSVSGSCVSNQVLCNFSPLTIGYVEEFRFNEGSYTDGYACAPNTGPAGVDIDATIWTDNNRISIFSSQTGDGPLWAYSQAPYRISWGEVTNANTCEISLNGGTPISVSVYGGSINTYFVPVGQTTLTYNLTCNDGATYSTDSVIINIPPQPLNGNSSCTVPNGTFSWTAPSGYTTFDTEVTNTTDSVLLGPPATQNNFVGTSINFTTLAGKTYAWKVKTKHTGTGAFSDWTTGNFVCSACIPLTFNDANSGFSLVNTSVIPTTGLVDNIEVVPGQNFYAYVDYGSNTTDSIIGPRTIVAGITNAFDVFLGFNNGASNKAARFGYANISNAPKLPGDYIYTSGIENKASNYCADGPRVIGTVTVRVAELSAGGITPLTATVGTPQAFTATITNSGNTSTGSSFNNLFQVATDSSGTGASTISVNSRAALAGGVSGTVMSSGYPFPSSGTYYVRACADNDASFVGTINEVNNDNNCSDWTPINVSPSGGAVVNPSCTDATAWYTAGGTGIWGYRKIFQIDDSKVLATQTDFPVLISTTTDSNLKSVSNGGLVNSVDGNDIVFTNSSGTKLDHEIERYSPTTGELIAWVKIPTLTGSGGGDTKIYMYYGGPSTTNQQNVTGVWSNNYRGVWHLPNGSTLSMLDSTSNNNDGSAVNGPLSPSSAKVDGGVDLENGGSQAIIMPENGTLDITGPLTLSAWVKLESFGGDNKGIIAKWDGISGAYRSYILGVNSSGQSIGIISSDGIYNSGNQITGTALGTANFVYVNMVYNPSNSILLYHNGDTTPVASDITSVPASIASKDANFIIGRQYTTATAPIGTLPQYFDGIIDEARVSNVARSAQWIATEYNNQSVAPYGNFYGVSTQCLGAPVTTFTANPTSGVEPLSITLTWSSTNNATDCTVPPPGTTGWSGAKASSNLVGQVISGLMANSYTFSLYCSNSAGNSPTVSIPVVVSGAAAVNYNLTVNKTIGGYVKSGDGKINCGTSCTSSYTDSSNVILTAYPNTTAWKFITWSGDCSGTNPICNINISGGNKSVTAIFAPRAFIYEEF